MNASIYPQNQLQLHTQQQEQRQRQEMREKEEGGGGKEGSVAAGGRGTTSVNNANSGGSSASGGGGVFPLPVPRNLLSNSDENGLAVSTQLSQQGVSDCDCCV